MGFWSDLSCKRGAIFCENEKELSSINLSKIEDNCDRVIWGWIGIDKLFFRLGVFSFSFSSTERA